MSKTSILQKAAELQRKLDKGLVKGKKQQVRTRQYIAHLKWKAKQGDKPKATKKVAKKPAAKKVYSGRSTHPKHDGPTPIEVIEQARELGKRQSKTKQVNPNQGFLPHFLKQMNMVRIEELVAEKIFRTILGERTDQEIIQETNQAINDAVAQVFPVHGRKA